MLKSLSSAPLLFFFIFFWGGGGGGGGVTDVPYLQFKFDVCVIKPTKVTSSNCV